MVCGKLRDVGVIQICVQTDEKSHGTKFARRNFIEPDGIAVRVKVQPRDGIGNFHPRAVVALQRKVTDEIADTCDGKRFTSRIVVTQRSGLERFAGNFRRDLDLQRGGKCGARHRRNAERQNDFPQTVHFGS